MLCRGKIIILATVLENGEGLDDSDLGRKLTVDGLENA